MFTNLANVHSGTTLYHSRRLCRPSLHPSTAVATLYIGDCPLVNIQKTMENHHAIFMGSHPLFRLGHGFQVAILTWPGWAFFSIIMAMASMELEIRFYWPSHYFMDHFSIKDAPFFPIRLGKPIFWESDIPSYLSCELHCSMVNMLFS